MKLTSDQIQHVAKLANLPLSEEELVTYSSQLSAILDYIDHLRSVDTENVDPTYNVTGFSTQLATTSPKDIVPSLLQGDALANAPISKNGFFVTKGVFEEA